MISHSPDAEQEALDKASRVIRQFLMGRPPDLSQGEQFGKHKVIVAFLAQAFINGHDEVVKTWDSLRHHDPVLTAAVEGRLARTTDPSQRQCTDLGNAERLVVRYGSDIRYCYPWRAWLIWDGKRWRKDERGEIYHLAKATVQGIYAEASDAPDQDRRQKVGKWAVQSEAEARIKAMVALAESEPGVPILPAELDRDPWLLNCANGTIDLRTGQPRPHRRQDLLTKLSPVSYDQNAICPTWDKFLDDITQGDPELTNFLRRAVGYSLSGNTQERVLFICCGVGRNGKSTFLETVAEMLGEDYALRTPTETFMTRRDGNIPNDLAQLPGRRFVHASETEEGKRLAEALIKDLTGRDTISARFMRGEWFQFKPVCKLWLRTNHKPVIRGTDPAIWDRVRLIPFAVRFEAGKEDKRLAEKLQGELPGILIWAVQGCLSWQMHGLGLPDNVKAATAGYQAEMDVLADYIRERCLEKPSAKVGSTELFTDYLAWCERNAEGHLSRKAFVQRLEERGFRRKNSLPTGGVAWHGIQLLK